MNQVIVVPYKGVTELIEQKVKYKDYYVETGNLKSLESIRKEYGEDCIVHFLLDDIKYSIYKDYVIAPIPNAFNIAVSYWISKKGYTSSYYCFSTNSYDESLITEEEFMTYVDYFETRLRS